MNNALRDDAYWMDLALEEARAAALAGEIPVGAVIVSEEGQIIALGRNDKEATRDPLGHAEIRALQTAALKLGRWRLTGCTLYVTLEPCVMCAGSIVQARVDRVVYGTKDPKAGAVASIYQVLQDPRLNHSPAVTYGVRESECSELLKGFFRQLRAERAQTSV